MNVTLTTMDASVKVIFARAGRVAAVILAAFAVAACTASHGGAKPRPTPPPSGASHAALSGGTFVRVEGDGYDQIYVLPPGAAAWRLVGDTPKPPLAAGRYWTLAPDGRLGAYIVEGSSLFVQGVDGGPARLIATAPTGETICAPAWSADSARLTYVERRPTATGVAGTTYAVAADGTGAVVVPGAATDGACDRPAASAGGTVAFASHGALVVATGPTERTVPTTIKSEQVLAVSAASAVVVAGARVYLVDLRSGAAVALPGVVPGGPVAYDGGGRVLALVGTVIKTFDTAGRIVTTSPAVTTRPAATISMVISSP